MALKTEYALVGVILSLVVGAGAGFVYNQNISSERISFLENRYEVLEENYTTLDANHVKLEAKFDELESSFSKLKNDYRGLLKTVGIIDAKNYSRTEGFELLAGQNQRYEYDVGYGIIWVVDVSHTYKGGSRFTCHIGWWQGEQGGEVSGGSDTLEQQLPGVTGTVSTYIHDEGDVLFIRTNVIIPDVPRFSREGSGRLLKQTFEEP